MVLKGISDIKNAYIGDENHKVVYNLDGSCKSIKDNVIYTIGSNLQALLEYGGGWEVVFEKHKQEFYAGEMDVTNWYQENQHEITLEFLQGLKRSMTKPGKNYLGDPSAKNIHM